MINRRNFVASVAAVSAFLVLPRHKKTVEPEIKSSDWNTYMQDIQSALNSEWPIQIGGTGAYSLAALHDLIPNRSN
jgi:hypothetical protein